MTRLEKIYFVKAMADDLQHALSEQINSGKVPEAWDGFELRRWFAERAAETSGSQSIRMIPSRLRKYNGTRLRENI